MVAGIVSFGKQRTYRFQFIDIDEKWGQPIYLDDEIIGGCLFRKRRIDNRSLTFIEVIGIEILPQYRRRGLASELIREIQKECDIVMGALVSNGAIPFWRSLGAKMRRLPTENFPEEILKEIDVPLSFYLAETPEANEYMEKIMINLPVFATK